MSSFTYNSETIGVLSLFRILNLKYKSQGKLSKLLLR